VREFTPPARDLGPHVAAIGMRFYTGRMFPEKYRGGVFIAEHGSWNRSTPIGYRVTFVKIENGRATLYEPFASGGSRQRRFGAPRGRPRDARRRAAGLRRQGWTHLPHQLRRRQLTPAVFPARRPA
jgi:glucose/arabinose dehydrogenase